MARAKTAVTLVTGYLGSGKTTLVNRMLAGAGASKIAVLVNEFGAVGIDGALIEGASMRTIELANGCLCCVVTGEFQAALNALEPGVFDRVIIETSGAADPTSVIRLLWGAPELTSRYRLDGVVCVADGRNFFRAVQADPLVLLQASVADLVLISKVDRADPLHVAGIRKTMGELNPVAGVLECDLGAASPIPLEKIFGLDAYRSPGALLRMAASAPTAGSHGDLTSVSASWEGKVRAPELQAFFRGLVMTGSLFGDQIVRTKALLHVEGETRPWLIQGVQTWLERGVAPRSYKGPNRLVVLGRGLNAPRLHAAIDRLKTPSGEALATGVF